MNLNSLLLLLPALVTANKCAARKNVAGQVMTPVTMGVDPTNEPPKCVSVNTGACAGYVILIHSHQSSSILPCTCQPMQQNKFFHECSPQPYRLTQQHYISLVQCFFFSSCNKCIIFFWNDDPSTIHR